MSSTPKALEPAAETVASSLTDANGSHHSALVKIDDPQLCEHAEVIRELRKKTVDSLVEIGAI